MKIKMFSSLLLLGAALLLNAAEKNLLQNGDLSSFDSKKNLRNWRVEKIEMSGKTVNGVPELNLLPLFKYGRHYVSLNQRIPELAAGRYKFTGEVRGNLKSIYMLVNMLTPAGYKNQLKIHNFKTAPENWTAFAIEFDMIPENKSRGFIVEVNAHKKGDMIRIRKLKLVRTGNAAPAAPVVKKAPAVEKAPAAKKDKNVRTTANAYAAAPAVTINGKLVARPAAASKVVWPKHLFCGKDYWYMLEPQWRTMKGLSHEKFIQEAGVRGIGTPWKAAAPYRRTGINEIEVWQDGKNVARQAKFEVTSDEWGTKFYYLPQMYDGDLTTAAWICGPTKDFRYLNKGALFDVMITLPSDKPVDKIVFRTNKKTLPVWDGTPYVGKTGKVIKSSITREDDRFTIQLSKAPRTKKLYLKCTTKHTVYTAAADLHPQYKKLVKNRPFTSSIYNGTLKFKGIGEFNLENVDRESIRRFRAKYPNFIPEQQLEISANFFQRRAYKSKAAWENNSAKVAPYDRNRYEAAETLRKYWSLHFELFDGITMLEGGLWTMPYYYEWGANLTIPEAYNEGARYSSNRHLLTFSRGGARQYNKPFGFYQTVFGEATSADAKYSQAEARRLAKLKKNPWHSGEDFGVSPTYHKRLLMLAYYAGASLQQFESEPWGYAKRDNKTHVWSLTGNGKSIKTVYDWVSSPKGKRGDFYAPIMILNDYFSGNWEWRQGKEWKVWYMYPYEDGDYMIRHLLNELDPPIGNYKTMQVNSNGMRNSELGDIYDVYFANAPSGAVTPQEMGKYPVVLLTGSIRKVDGLTENLQKYVKEGGTLVLNSAQLDLITPKFAGVRASKKHVISNSMKILEVTPAGAEVLVKDSCGLPLVTRYKNGKGHVILATPYHMLNIKDKKKTIPLLRALLLKLQKEVLPVSIKGDILFCFNKMSGNDWKLILINNKGTYKDTRETKEKIFPEYAQKVTFSLPKGATAKELRLNLPVKVKNGQAEVVVPSGDVAVVELKNIPFTDKPINAGTFNRKPSDPDVKAHSINPKILFESKTGEGGLHYNTQKRGDALYFSGDQTGVIFSTNVKQIPMPEGGYCCFAKPEDLKKPLQIVMSNEYTRIDIVNGHWQLFFYDLKQRQSIRGPKVIPGKWTHIAFTWKNGHGHFYIDGKEIISESGPLLFGGRCDGCNNTYAKQICYYLGTFHLWRRNLFKGYVRDIKLFGVAPSSEQIKKMAEGNK